MESFEAKLNIARELAERAIKTGTGDDALWKVIYPMCKAALSSPSVVLQCVDIYKRVVDSQKDPKNRSVVLTHIGDLHRYINQKQDAEACYFDALSLQPKNGINLKL